jgi:DNA-directed RNA polymerase specialized sigma24 family protein
LREISNPTAYLNATVVNLARNWQRGQRRRSARERHGLRIVESTDAPEADNLHEDLLKMVDRLPFRQRTDLVGCQPGTVKSLSSRALDALRKELP